MRSPREDQERVFRLHIDLSRETAKPLVVHVRDAWPDVLRVLDEGSAEHVVIHCFSGDAEIARECAAREMEEETCYRCHNLRPLIRLAIEGGTLLFFWENYDGRQPVACREGQGLEFVDRRKVESLPKQPYLTDVFDLALAAQKRVNVRLRAANQLSPG
jgi:hypothetical protein